MGELTHVDALGADGAYRTCRRMDITCVAGEKAGEISLVPPLYVRHTMAALRAAPVPRASDRFAMLAEAARIYLHGTVGGMDAERYALTVSLVSGAPLPVVRDSITHVADTLRALHRTAGLAMPTGAVADWNDVRTKNGSAVWTRRGEVFTVLTSGNTPAVHGLWPEALALGYKVAVRPSNREPFTAFRLISALREAGFGNDVVALLPTDHHTADSLVSEADYAMVYGGQDVVDKYAGSPRVLPQGPGRCKVLVTKDVDWRQKIDLIADAVSHLGGTACICTTAVLVEGDPAPLAAALAQKLSQIPSLPADDPAAVLTVQPREQADRIGQNLRTVAHGARAWLGGNGIVDELPSGGAVLRPAVYEVFSADAPQLNVELPFPCVWVGPWSPEDGVAPLRRSLAVTVMTEDQQLIESLLNEPTVTNVYIGDNPTTWTRPGVPHDGYVGEFLMRTKAVIQ
ncbi:aldehyde dehydrogenase family protein (plasmid) [Streptomyces murinus]|uniref:aldehyde dehydrogenase family protein n=1 Tax=Streptomyces murinus TaxID=33900 RepID=UPI000A1E1741|nr:aldehyde dehydrogenase family protein [Streptomyces murinus]WDO11344.1 aldehyde dehydrogenase family protein [Streptomyces murinus]